MALSKDEREQFLSEPHIAALSVFAGDSRGPLTVPIWYQYSPGYLEYSRRELGDQVAVYLEPRHWLSADLGSR